MTPTNPSPQQSENQMRRMGRWLSPADLRWFGKMTLALGLATALVLYFLLPSDNGASEISSLLAIGDSKQAQLRLSYAGGNAAVAMARLNDWFSGLWHGRPLAIMIALLSLLVAAFCFAIAKALTPLD